MFYIRVADMTVCIENKYDYVEKLCRKYIVEPSVPDFTVSANEAETEAEKIGVYDDCDAGALESIAIYRKICVKALEFDTFLMHAAAIAVDGNAYAFAAKSGTGKTTHVVQWGKLLKGRVEVINGDKPLLQYKNGVLYACGTPWCGKENWSANKKAPLKALGFIERAEQNSVTRISFDKAIPMILQQISHSSKSIDNGKLLDLAIKSLSTVPIYLIKCDISTDAARLAYETMKGEN